jgi:hypothetical protein
MPGANENSPDDMNRAVTALARIQDETSAALLVIHHSGKTAERGARGHSSLRAAVDAELLVSRDKSGRALTVMKQRDGADQLKIAFDLEPKLITTSDDEATQTLVVRAVLADESQPTVRLKESTRKAHKALKDSARASGRVLDPAEADALQVPRGIRVVTWSEWLDACRAAGLAKGTDGAVRKAQRRAATELREAGQLGEGGDFVWLIPSGPSGGSGQSSGTRTGQDR